MQVLFDFKKSGSGFSGFPIGEMNTRRAHSWQISPCRLVVVALRLQYRSSRGCRSLSFWLSFDWVSPVVLLWSVCVEAILLTNFGFAPVVFWSAISLLQLSSRKAHCRLDYELHDLMHERLFFCWRCYFLENILQSVHTTSSFESKAEDGSRSNRHDDRCHQLAHTLSINFFQNSHQSIVGCVFDRHPDDVHNSFNDDQIQNVFDEFFDRLPPGHISECGLSYDSRRRFLKKNLQGIFSKSQNFIFMNGSVFAWVPAGVWQKASSLEARLSLPTCRYRCGLRNGYCRGFLENIFQGVYTASCCGCEAKDGSRSTRYDSYHELGHSLSVNLLENS